MNIFVASNNIIIINFGNLSMIVNNRC